MSAINRQVTPTAPIPSLSPAPTHTQAPSSAPTQTTSTGPSPRLQSRVQQSQQQTAQSAQTTSPQTVQQGSQLIAQAPPSAVQAQHSQSSTVLKATQFGSQLASYGAKVHDASEAIGETAVMGKVGEVVEAATTPFEVGSSSIRTAESHVLEYATGLSPETLKGAKDLLETGQTVMQACKTVNSLQTAYQSYGTAEFSSNLATAGKETFIALGGKPTVELCSKVGDFCSSMSMDSAVEVAKAATEFGSDDSIISGLGRTALSTAGTACLGSTATNVISSSIPFLSYGVAAMDTATAVQKNMDWYNGKCTATDAIKSTVTAIGSGTGATVAPVIGPLAAAGVNLAIDGVSYASEGVSKAYNFVSSWWS